MSRRRGVSRSRCCFRGVLGGEIEAMGEEETLLKARRRWVGRVEFDQ